MVYLFEIGRLADRISDSIIGLVALTLYYVTVEKSGTTVTVTVRTGSHEGTVVGTATVECPADESYTYKYGAQSYNQGTASFWHYGYVQNYTFTPVVDDESSSSSESSSNSSSSESSSESSSSSPGVLPGPPEGSFSMMGIGR